MRLWFDGANPIGRHVTAGPGSREIVGVVGDVLQRNPRVPAAPQLLLPFAQLPGRTVRFVVRTPGDPGPLMAEVQARMRALDPSLAVAELEPLDRLVAESVARPRFYAALVALFAALGLTLAAIGIFGVSSYTVVQQSREIGIRMALGARASEVVWLVVRRAVGLAGFGLALGLGVSGAFSRVLRTELFGVSPLDPLTLASVIAVLGAAAVAASYLPARRAAALDPNTVLREG